MADQTAGAAAPVAAPATEAPAGAPAEAPLSGATPAEVKISGRQRAHERGERVAREREAARTARERALEQPRDENGQKFVAAEAAQAASVADTEAGAAPGDVTDQQAVQGPPAGMVRIDLPEGHPLREQGRTHVDVPAADERFHRSALNAASRRAEVEAISAREAEANARAARLEAELRFVRERGNEFWTPEDQHLYDDIIASYTPSLGAEGAKARAEAFKRGRENEAQSAMQGVQEEAELQQIADYWNNEGQVFRQAAHDRLPQLFEGLASHEIAEAVDMYATRLASVERQAWENNKHLMSRAEFDRRFAASMKYSDQDFFAVTRDYLETRPGVVAAKRARAEHAEIARRTSQADTDQAVRDRQRDAGRRHATNPQRALGGVATSSGAVNAEPEQPDFTKMSPDAIRKYRRDHATQMGNAMGGSR